MGLYLVHFWQGFGTNCTRAIHQVSPAPQAFSNFLRHGWHADGTDFWHRFWHQIGTAANSVRSSVSSPSMVGTAWMDIGTKQNDRDQPDRSRLPRRHPQPYDYDGRHGRWFRLRSHPRRRLLLVDG